MSESRPDLSVLVVNWNTCAQTLACLRSVTERMQGIEYELIVVDNASGDGSAAAIRAANLPRLRLIESPVNTGFVGGNNLAAAQARGRYWLLLNSDTLVLSADTGRIIDYLDQHPEVALAGGPVVDEAGQGQFPGRRFPSPWVVFLVNTVHRVTKIETPAYRRSLCRNLSLDAPADVDWIVGAYLYVRAHLVRGAPLLDERIFMYYEDTLLGHRLKQQGYKVRYLPFAPVFHAHGLSANKARAATIYYCFEASQVYLRTLYGPLLARCYRALARLTWGLFAMLFGLIGHCGHAKSAEKGRLFRELLTWKR
ncbi:MAG TPA: glycosyltransferase family 2 protein [Pseudomonadales bacterium]|nr:glycosyltransferase family 2 protein [Pseudomonadales bacterium]